MVVMCLDHTREYFGDLRLNPEDLTTTTPSLFYTRWVTHFCAPTFVFLAGVSAWMYGRLKTKTELSAFLLTRGIWLLVLEFTVVHFAWFHGFGTYPFMFIVIAAIGASMVAMAAMVFLPDRAIATIGLGIVILHNSLDWIVPEDFGAFSDLWILLHEGGFIPRLFLNVGYPVLPWIGVMACGYSFGRLLQQHQRPRISACLATGIGCVSIFIILRSLNLYGDAGRWAVQENGHLTVMSFLSTTKYPPSVLYLTMTLGPALIILAAFDMAGQGEVDVVPKTMLVEAGQVLRPLILFGRVPLFFYVAHLYLIHCGSRLLYLFVRGTPISPLQTAFDGFEQHQEIYGFDLWVVYVAWGIMLSLLLPLCWWYGRLKARGKSRIWSYL